MALNFRLETALLQDFPDLLVGALRVRGLAAAAGKVGAAELVTQAAQHVAATLTQETLMADPRIVAWREAYGRVKAKPSQYRSSIEALARRAVKGGSPITNIPAVDIYNAVSLASLAPLGAYDVARLPQGDMTMRRVDPAQDSFAPLGGKELDFPLHQGLVVYATGAKVLCWGFNCRDASDTCLTAETDDGVFFGEAVFPAHHAALHEAFAKLKALLTEAGAACGDVKLASASCPSFAL